MLKKPDISIQDKAKFSQELQTIIDENPDFKSESHTKVSQGGDKHRLTLTNLQVVRGWFDPDSHQLERFQSTSSSFPVPSIVVWRTSLQKAPGSETSSTRSTTSSSSTKRREGEPDTSRVAEGS